MLRRGIAVVTASALALILTLSVVSASPNAQTGSVSSPFQFLVAVLADANDKGLLPDSLTGLLSDLFIEDLISPHTGETPEQVRGRLSAEGQSTFQFLIAVLTDADDKDVLADDISASLSDWIIENLIAPKTDETPAQVRERLSDTPDGTAVADRAVLVALYNATDGPNWTNNSNWLSDAPIREWRGVSTDDRGRVTELYLSGNALNGIIPSDLGSLSKLEYLALHANHLRGTIPPELGKLSALRILTLEYNDLNGTIPPELGNLSHLRILSLSDNQLRGTIPSELGKLSELRRLHLQRNGLTGTIPPELGSLRNLKRLHLQSNELTGAIPSELGRLSNLQYLFLNLNRLSEVIPPELGNLSNLRYLYLSDNQLRGTIPSELGNISGLFSLSVSNNQLSGAIPPELKKVAELAEFEYTGNRLSGCVPHKVSV